MDAKAYGQALRQWRENKAGLSQRELARAAGMHPNTLGALENKGQGLRTDLFIRLCLLMGAEPLVIADHAYYNYRQELSAQADRLRCVRRDEGEDGAGAPPSLEEAMRRYDKKAVASRSLFQYLIRGFGPDLAVRSYLQERFEDLALDFGPEPPQPKGK